MKNYKKRKILYLTFHPHIGGGEIILLSLLENINSKFFEPVVIVTQKGQLSQKLKKLGIKTHVLPLSGYFFRLLFIPGASFFGIYQFLKLAKKIKPDLIHLNHLNLAVYCALAKFFLKIPVVATAHGPWDAIYFYQDIVNNVFCDKILANTHNVAKSILKRKIVKPKKVKVVPFGVDLNKFKPGNKEIVRKKLGLPQNKLIITIVGRIDPVKDHLTFLRATNIVHKKYPNTIFYIVGSALGDFSKNNNTIQKIKDFLKNNPNLSKVVVFGGFIENMPAVYNASDILVSTSVSESFGLALAEAAACGLPVISTNIGGQGYIVKDGQTGFLVSPKNPEILAQKILLLTKNKSLRIRLGKGGRQYIKDNFELKKYVRKVEKVYLKLLKA